MQKNILTQINKTQANKKTSLTPFLTFISIFTLAILLLLTIAGCSKKEIETKDNQETINITNTTESNTTKLEPEQKETVLKIKFSKESYVVDEPVTGEYALNYYKEPFIGFTIFTFSREGQYKSKWAGFTDNIDDSDNGKLYYVYTTSGPQEITKGDYTNEENEYVTNLNAFKMNSGEYISITDSFGHKGKYIYGFYLFDCDAIKNQTQKDCKELNSEDVEYSKEIINKITPVGAVQKTIVVN